jgi:hypothetical protein
MSSKGLRVGGLLLFPGRAVERFQRCRIRIIVECAAEEQLLTRIDVDSRDSRRFLEGCGRAGCASPTDGCA